MKIVAARMKRKRFLLLFIFMLFTNFLIAQEYIELHKDGESIESTEDSKNSDNDKQLAGMAFSFSGFNEFRLGMGVFFGKLGSDGHHPLGDDFGLLFEYNLKDTIAYTRFYYHFTGGPSAALLGGSMVIAYDNDDMSIGFAPEIGIGLSTVFKMFFRYNFYINNRFNGYEVVFHLCLAKK